ncbi:MAG: PilW family protein [Gammaproteobacteria bacterium]|nr:PilW family protein [Gammaproteobacteria bacterium]
MIRGFTLLELLISMALGALLLGGVATLYLSNKAAYNAQQDLARLQEKGRIATEVLTSNISMAGYAGCETQRFLGTPIMGFSSNNVPGYLQGKVAAGTDVIIIQAAAAGITHLTEDINNPTDTIKVANNPASKTNPLLLISDCSHYNKITSASYGGKTIKLEGASINNYQIADTEVAIYAETAYFIAETADKNDHGKAIYALYEEVNQGEQDELIDGVRNMQIIYGVDTNGDDRVNSYLRAAEIKDWSKVLSVAITLYFQTDNDKLKPWQIYIALQEKVAA